MFLLKSGWHDDWRESIVIVKATRVRALAGTSPHQLMQACRLKEVL
jgi:hypothetical protein